MILEHFDKMLVKLFFICWFAKSGLNLDLHYQPPDLPSYQPPQQVQEHHHFQQPPYQHQQDNGAEKIGHGGLPLKNPLEIISPVHGGPIGKIMFGPKLNPYAAFEKLTFFTQQNYLPSFHPRISSDPRKSFHDYYAVFH